MKKNRITLIILFVLSLVFVYYFGGRIPYTLFSLTIILPLISILYTIIVFVRFKFIQEIDKKYVIKGDTVLFKCNFTNEDFLYFPYIKAVFSSSKEIFEDEIQDRYFSLIPKEKLSFSLKLNCKYRGIYEIGVQHIEIEDFLGILKLKYSVQNTKLIYVSPRVNQIKNLFIKSSYTSETETNLGKVASENSAISDIRKYIYGDSIKRIHWKSTAHYGEFMSKNYQSTTENSMIIMIDLLKHCNENYKNIVVEDMLLETVVSIIYYSLNHYTNIKLLIWDDNLLEIEGKDIKDFDNIYNIISKLKFEHSFNVTNLFETYLSTNRLQSNIFLFSSHLSYELYTDIYKAVTLGFNINLVNINPEELNENYNEDKVEILKNLTQMGVCNYTIRNCDDINVVFEKDMSEF